jgi:riboflavin synthase
VFTGIVEEVGTVMEVALDADVVVVRIEGGPAAAALAAGGSIAVNGCCLTAVAVKRSEFTCHLTAETLSRTSFGAALHPGARVNLERPLPADGRFDGHIVQGHVDGVGKVVRLTRREHAAELVVAAPARLARYLVEKGSVAVDGVSLTVAALRGSAFTVALIPYTLERTNLHAARPGTRVNLEADIIAKYVERLLGPPRGVRVLVPPSENRGSPRPGRSKRPGRARKRP